MDAYRVKPLLGRIVDVVWYADLILEAAVLLGGFLFLVVYALYLAW